MTVGTIADAEIYISEQEQLELPYQGPALGICISEEDFFWSACKQARIQSAASRQLQGPHHQTISSALAVVDNHLKAIHTELHPEHLMSSSYQSPEARTKLCQLSKSQHTLFEQIQSLCHDRATKLHALGHEWAISDVVNLSEGVLNKPDYMGQHNARACFNACFRMVFKGITHYRPHEETLARAMRGNYVAHDDEFLNIFSTNKFKQIFPEKNVQVLTISGAGIETLSKLALKMKSKRPNAEVFSIVALESESTGGSDIWHSSVLLAANKDEVVIHDPSKGHNRSIDTVRFHERWAVAHNRAHLIIAA